MPKNGKRNSNPKKPKNNNISADSQNLDSSIKSNEPHELSHLEKLRIAEDDQTELGTLPTHNSLTETNDAAILARFNKKSTDRTKKNTNSVRNSIATTQNLQENSNDHQNQTQQSNQQQSQQVSPRKNRPISGKSNQSASEARKREIIKTTNIKGPAFSKAKPNPQTISKIPKTRNTLSARTDASQVSSIVPANYNYLEAQNKLDQLLKDNERLRHENDDLKKGMSKNKNNNDTSNHNHNNQNLVKLKINKNKSIHETTRELNQIEIMKKFQELKQENQMLREKNSELILLQNRTDENYEHLKAENDDLRTRMVYLERVVNLSTAPADVTENQINKKPLKGMKNRNISSHNVPNSTNYSNKNGMIDDDLESILSKPVSRESNTNSTKDKKRAALQNLQTTSLADTLQKNPRQPRVVNRIDDNNSRLPNSSYLKRYTKQQNSQGNSIVTGNNNSASESSKPSPRAVHIIKPKAKMNEITSYRGSYSDKYRKADSPVPALDFNQFESNNDKNKKEDDAVFFSVLKKKQKPAINSNYSKNNNNNNQLEDPIGTHLNSKLNSLRTTHKNMRDDIKDLETQIRLLNKKS